MVTFTLTLGTAITLALSDGSAKIGSVPTIVICSSVAFGINWLAFIPSYLRRTEHYFDLIGSVTHITLVIVALAGSSEIDARSILVAIMVGVWAFRLGSFLFLRAQKTGGDGRFDAIKHHPDTFFSWWSLQALWVFMTGSCALAVITSNDRQAFGWVATVGTVIWVTGFLIEVLADLQKSRFRSNEENSSTFIHSGLWAWSRHPNYFGEILLWIGIALISVPILSGWSWAALISPAFVIILLTRMSGIPILERRGRDRWGGDEKYQEYLQNTPILLMRKPKVKMKDL